ncbi:hypothetical protein HPHPH28_1335 [Helicobacter pylori Hp H-28]|nr:hypothetical protein HPHPH28_1335 [Helicobacter pylori Hp H-28]
MFFSLAFLFNFTIDCFVCLGLVSMLLVCFRGLGFYSKFFRDLRKRV